MLLHPQHHAGGLVAAARTAGLLRTVGVRARICQETGLLEGEGGVAAVARFCFCCTSLGVKLLIDQARLANGKARRPSRGTCGFQKKHQPQSEIGGGSAGSGDEAVFPRVFPCYWARV